MSTSRKTYFVVMFLVLVLCVGGPVAANAKEYVLKLGHANDPDPKNSVFHAMCLVFEMLVENYTGGKVEVQIFPACQLGGEQEQVRACQLGTQEATLVSMNNLNVFATSLGFFTLPYIFETVEEGRFVIDTLWDQLNEWCIPEAGVRILVITDAGFRNLTNSKRPVTKLADLKGLKIRVPNNPIMVAAFKSWGLDPIPMGWPIFSELQQKVIDGQENPYNVLLAVKFYEVQKYVTDIDYVFQTGTLIVSEKFYKSLPKDLQKAVVMAGKHTMAWERNYIEGITVSDINRLKKLGIVFLGPPVDKPEWIKRARGIWSDLYKGIGSGDPARGKEIVDRVVATAEKFRKKK